MDRSKEDDKQQPPGEEKNKSTKPILTPLITTTNILAAATDDDASTESSDTFETWTLVSDKQKKNDVDREDDGGNRIEILKKEDNEEEPEHDGQEENVQEQQLQDSLNDVTNDDFSDGISIISESESVGRISPHPYLRDHLHDLNMKFSLNDSMDDEILNRLRYDTPIVLQQDLGEQQLRQRRPTPPSTPANNQEDRALQKASQTLALASDFPPFVKRGLQGIFYVGVGLAILALIGKIMNPTWQPLASVVNPSPSTAELEQKVSDMELQNNLMRAEIDLLNKQVKYLNTINEPQQRGKYKDHKESKTFKAWSGNGDSLRPVDITNEDLRRPYKCPDGSYVEIANMCMEQRSPHDPSIIDQFGQVVDDLKQQSEAFKTFEKVAEELQGFQDNPFEQLKSILGEDEVPTPRPQNEFIKNKPIYQPSEEFIQQLPKPNNEDIAQQQRKYDSSKDSRNKFGKEFKKPYDNNKPSKERYEKSRDNLKDRKGESDEKFDKFKDNSRFRDNSKERSAKKFDDSQESKENDSKERDNSRFRDNSKERRSRKLNDSQESKENNSKERFNRQQKRKFDKKDHDDDDDSGEWQEKYMKHREDQRKQNQQKYQDNKNWYIKRGDSREHKRSGEKQFR